MWKTLTFKVPASLLQNCTVNCRVCFWRRTDCLGTCARNQVCYTRLSRATLMSAGAQTLTLKWTPGLGHICHLKGRDSSRSLEALGNIRRVNSSKSTMSFYLPQWTQLGT